ncbi:MAG: hypothetical protein KF774_13840 [Planctomyces sp.]|nr:hypothetical protein [Planctomyces sp.]
MTRSSDTECRMRIVVLEDDRDRQGEFSSALSAKFPAFELCFAETAGDAIRLLDEAFDRIALADLDHDLNLLMTSAGNALDPGCGQDVVDYLLRHAPGFPVLIHTTNDSAGARMQAELTDAEWTTRRVVPYGDLEWVAEVWAPAARDLIVESVPAAGHDSLASPTPARAGTLASAAVRSLAQADRLLNDLCTEEGAMGARRDRLVDIIGDLRSRIAQLAKLVEQQELSGTH